MGKLQKLLFIFFASLSTLRWLKLPSARPRSQPEEGLHHLVESAMWQGLKGPRQAREAASERNAHLSRPLLGLGREQNLAKR